MKVKTIDIQAKEWFDRINGNSYFSATVTINFGMKGEKSFDLPFQYGYSDQYIQEATNELNKLGIIETGEITGLWQYCRDNKIILRTSKKENCLKRELTRKAAK